MRIPRNGRGAFPAVDEETLALWRFDAASADELLSGRMLGDGGIGASAPSVSSSSPILRALAFDGATDYRQGAPAADEVAAWLGRWTFTFVMRWTANPTGVDVPFVFGFRTGDAAAADNFLFSLQGELVGTPARIRMKTLWEDASQANVETIPTSWRMRLGQWQWVTYRKRDPEGTEAGPVVLDVFVNGALVETFDGLDEASDGGDAVWSFGGVVDSAGTGTTQEAAVDLAAAHLTSRIKTDAEIRDDFRRGILQCFPTRVHHRVEVEDPSAALVDMGNHEGVDWVRSIRVEDDTNTPMRTGDVEFVREHGRLSLARLRTDSKLNLPDPFDLLGYDPLIEFGRQFVLSYANMPHMLSPSSSDFEPLIDGQMDEPDWGGAGETMRVAVRDLGLPIMKKYVRTIRDYPRTNFGTGGCPADAAPFESMLQEFIDDNFTGIVLYARDDPDFCARVLDPKLAQGNALPTLRMLAAQVAMDLRYLWDPITETFRLTLFDVGRDRVDADVPLSRDDVIGVNRAAQSSANVRNHWYLVYPNADDLDQAGNKLPGEVEASDAPSIAIFDEIEAEMREEQSSVIDNATDAQRMVDAALADTKDPSVNVSLTLPLSPWIEPLDLVEVEGDGIHWTSAQRVAVHKVTHEFANEGAGRTRLELRGTPGFDPRRWLEMEARVGLGRAPVADADAAVSTRQLSHRLGVYREFWDRSDLFAGEKYLDVKNGRLSQATRGDGYPPDGWRLSGGIGGWGIAAAFDKTVVNSGTRSVRFQQALAEIESDLVSVEGATLVGFEMKWARDTATTSTSLRVEVDWYIEDRVTAASTATSGPFVSPVLSGAGAFFTFRDVGIDVPDDARFFRVRVGLDVPGVFEEVILDHAAVITITPEFLVTLDNNQAGFANNTFTTILYDDGTSDPEHDYGGNVDTTTPTGVFTALQDGRYDFSAPVTAGITLGVGNVLEKVQARMIVDGATQIAFASAGYLRTFPAALGNPAVTLTGGEVQLIARGVFLRRGQTVEVQALVDQTAGAGTRTIPAGGRDRNGFEGKLVATE